MTRAKETGTKYRGLAPHKITPMLGADAEKLLLVQQIWDDLSGSDSIPLPDWAITEAKRRRDEMLADPNLGKTHSEVVDRIREWRDG